MYIWPSRRYEYADQVREKWADLPQPRSPWKPEGSRGTFIRLRGADQFDGFSVVDEARLGKLDDREAANLLRRGYLAWIYMHLLSIHNIADLSSRLDPRVEIRKSA